MPHVVINGNIDIDEIFQKMKVIFIQNEKQILRTEARYINLDKTSILIESLAIEKGEKRSFLAMVGRRESGLVVRIYPRFDVEKTDGVKLILVEIAKQILALLPNLKVGETNLQEYLK